MRIVDAPRTHTVTEPKPVAEPKPDTKAEPKPDTKAEPKPDTISVAEPKPDTKAEPKPDAQPKTVLRDCRCLLGGGNYDCRMLSRRAARQYLRQTEIDWYCVRLLGNVAG